MWIDGFRGFLIGSYHVKLSRSEPAPSINETREPFLNTCMSSSFKTCEKIICPNVKSNGETKSQVCTCHDSSAVVTCTKLWGDLINIFYIRAIIFTRLNGKLINSYWDGSEFAPPLTSPMNGRCVRYGRWSRRWMSNTIHCALSTAHHEEWWPGASELRSRATCWCIAAVTTQPDRCPGPPERAAELAWVHQIRQFW